MIAAESFFSPPLVFQPIQHWYWRKLRLDQRSGSQVFETLFLNLNHQFNPLDQDSKLNKIATLLESPTTPQNTTLARYSICAGAPRKLYGKPQIWTPPVGNILPFLKRLLEVQNQTSSPESIPVELPFSGGWLGWLGYDMAWEIEQLPHLNTDLLTFPTAYWYEPESFAVLDHHHQTLWLAATHIEQLDTLQNQLESGNQKTTKPSKISNSNHPITPIFCSSGLEYVEAVKKAQKYIQSGDIFQANLSLRFEAKTVFESWSIYRALQKINPSPFASYWQTPWGDMISCSPERLIQVSGRQVQTRPIAGTRKRGETVTQDEQLARELIANFKERAEHIMLVDLERNDLGKVCEWGTVKVNELLTIERYSHVMHLVSNIIGTLRPNYSTIDLIQGVFPGGTITGCPKVRCMEIIEELEPIKRNLFYGSCGYLDWRGNLDLNILIRTLLYINTGDLNLGAKVYGQVGAGIVADSNPKKEWNESLQKAQAQLQALNLEAIVADNTINK